MADTTATKPSLSAKASKGSAVATSQSATVEQDYYVPELNKSVKATSVEEAIKKASKGVK